MEITWNTEKFIVKQEKTALKKKKTDMKGKN